MKSKLKRRHLRQLTTLFNSKEDCEHNFKAALQAISHLVICLVYSKKHSKTNLFSRLSNVFLFCVIWKELLEKAQILLRQTRCWKTSNTVFKNSFTYTKHEYFIHFGSTSFFFLKGPSWGYVMMLIIWLSCLGKLCWVTIYHPI